MIFLERCCRQNEIHVDGFSADAMALLESYHWPGNVRELRNVVERMAILCDSDRIEARHLPPEIRQIPPQTSSVTLPRLWDEFKNLKHHIREAGGAGT